MKEENRVYVFDTTLRDGEQAAGCRLEVREKVAIAQQLARLGVDVIEAGFPCSSPKDFEAVRTVAQEVDGPVICATSRAVVADISRCGQAFAGVQRARIHTGIGVSDTHVRGKFGESKYGGNMGEKRACVLKMARNAVECAKSYVSDVEFYPEDAGRSEREFLMEMVETVVAAGATVVNIPDTTGYAVPEEFGALVREVSDYLADRCDVMVSVHCHNDLGMAVANTLAGVRNGARQVEGTINGIGERAGNAALEEVVMALRTRKEFFGVETNVCAKEICRSSRMVAKALGMPVPANKPIVGSNAFSHSSGIHVDGFLKDRATYEIMNPQDVGMPPSRVVLTARTGRSGVRHRIEKMGYNLSEDEMEVVYGRFLAVADSKREVLDEDLLAIV